MLILINQQLKIIAQVHLIVRLMTNQNSA